MKELKLAFYGDDFTGSTDAMDALYRSGVETVLLLEKAQMETVQREFPDADAIGIAGTSRSMTPEEMEEHLPDTLASLHELDPLLVHYKICSTFDSSPEIGSIGQAIDIGTRVFGSNVVPLLPGAPPLGRYVIFGNMFASDGEIVHRLDRHPTMSQHPVTPMDESDLRDHLSEQTEKSMGLVNVLSLDDSKEKLRKTFRKQAKRNEVLFFDSLSSDHLQRVGWLLWEYAQQHSTAPVFVVGSSGLEYALAAHWEQIGAVKSGVQHDPLDPVDSTLVMSGSASPVTDTQIQAATEAGFSEIRIQTDKLIRSDGTVEQSRVTDQIISEIKAGNSVVAYTARGPDDPAIERTKDVCSSIENPPQNVGNAIGKKQGEITRDVLAETGIDRVCIAGGDTCGSVASLLDIYALEVCYPLAPGSPLCRTSSKTSEYDNLEIALKGGQLGHKEYFIDLEQGIAD